MAANITVIDGATERRSYARNYTYAEAVTDLAALERVLLTDQNSEAFKNAAGDLKKNLRDASTTALTPATRIFFADATGAAGSHANLTFDGTNLQVGSSIFLKNGIYDVEIRLTAEGLLKFYRKTNGTGEEDLGLALGE